MPKRKTEESLGDRLARLRRERGITQDELARKLRLAQPNVSAYERNLYVPNATMVARIAQILGVSADTLLGLEPVASETKTIDHAVLRRLRRIEDLSRRDRAAMLRVLDALLAKNTGRKQRTLSRQAVGS